MNRKDVVAGLTALALSAQLMAANDSTGHKASTGKTIKQEINPRRLDSLLNVWYLSHPVTTSTPQPGLLDLPRDPANIDYPDSIYMQRLAKIPSEIPLTYNQIVKNFINVYTVKKRDKAENILGLKDYYFPLFETVLESYGLPLELKYLPVIESALEPRARSRMGATGLWQFMYPTARMYKLEINTLVDERRDPIQSTHAAARYLKDLYSIYEDWILVIAAYNCGPGNVNKAIRRVGYKKNYWDIYYYLPRETRGYVPAFIAATYFINYYKYHKLVPRHFSHTLPSDTVHVTEELHLEQVARVLQVPLKLLEEMNPQYRQNIIPKGNKKYTLKLPLEHVSRYIQQEDSILAYKDSVYFNPALKTDKPTYYSRHSPLTPKNKAKLYYTVKPGDNLGYIAEWYDVRTSDLRYWNGIRGNLIRRGQKLVVFVPKSLVSKYKDINSSSFLEKQGTASSSNSPPVVPETTPLPPDAEFIYYTVRRGDTLWEIAQKFPGVSDHEIMRWNGINNASRIQAGQTLKILKSMN